MGQLITFFAKFLQKNWRWLEFFETRRGERYRIQTFDNKSPQFYGSSNGLSLSNGLSYPSKKWYKSFLVNQTRKLMKTKMMYSSLFHQILKMIAMKNMIQKILTKLFTIVSILITLMNLLRLNWQHFQSFVRGSTI